MEGGGMTTYEWLTLIVVLLGGFWKVCRQLTKIEVALDGKVGYRDCENRQERCPLHGAFKELKERVDKMHPPKP